MPCSLGCGPGEGVGLHGVWKSMRGARSTELFHPSKRNDEEKTEFEYLIECSTGMTEGR